MAVEVSASLTGAATRLTGLTIHLTRHLPKTGYGALIKAYVQFLMTKLEYHAAHPEFTASFDYEEYVALKGIEDPNDG